LTSPSEACTEERFTDGEGDTFIRVGIAADGRWIGWWEGSDMPIKLGLDYIGAMMPDEPDPA